MIVDTIPKSDISIILLSNLRSLDGGFAASRYDVFIDGGGASFTEGDYYFSIDGDSASEMGGTAQTTYYNGILDGGHA